MVTGAIRALLAGSHSRTTARCVLEALRSLMQTVANRPAHADSQNSFDSMMNECGCRELLQSLQRHSSSRIANKASALTAQFFGESNEEGSATYAASYVF